MRKDGFTVCANNYINCLRQEGRYATAHVYDNALQDLTNEEISLFHHILWNRVCVIQFDYS